MVQEIELGNESPIEKIDVVERQERPRAISKRLGVRLTLQPGHRGAQLGLGHAVAGFLPQEGASVVHGVHTAL
jgi:hypothetical protein